MKKKINVNELVEILKKEFNTDFCCVDSIEVMTKGRTPLDPEHIEIGKGRVLNIHIDLGEEDDR